jgi:16S rRNA (cytidine1402-2'-O)-methyltransferase
MLYIVGTPIGNLEDISYRQAKILTTADIILCEDTRSIGRLFQKIEELFTLSPKANQKIISYYKEVEFEKLPEVITYLEDNKEVALISDSGMPLISDPGSELIKYIQKNAISVTAVPGPTAFVNAIVLSGFSFKHIFFYGFLPNKNNDMVKELEKIMTVGNTMKDTVFAFYESPERIYDTLKLIDKIIPSAKVALCREMTKKFEEITIGSAESLLSNEYKGEIVLLLNP